MKREKLLEKINFYNPVPDVLTLRASFNQTAAIQDPVDRLLALNTAANEAQQIIKKAGQNNKERKKSDTRWLAWTCNSLFTTGMVGSIATGVVAGVATGGVGPILLGIAVGAVGGAIGSGIVAVTTEATVKATGATKYAGMSGDMKNVFKEGRTAAEKLHREIETAFEETYNQLTPEMCAASRRSAELYHIFPRLEAEMQMVQMKASNAFAAVTGKPPAPSKAENAVPERRRIDRTIIG